jgi:hypothetical protein
LKDVKRGWLIASGVVQRLGNWIVEKMGGAGTPWSKERQTRNAQVSSPNPKPETYSSSLLLSIQVLNEALEP